MAQIVVLVGSLRRGSYNAALARAAVALAPPESRLLLASIRGIPLYDGDAEANTGIPVEVATLKDRIVSADGLLIVTPEYNNSLPGVLKNTIDWLSRPPADIPRVFGDLPTGLIGATPGSGGTRLSQAAWLPVLRTLGTRPFCARSLYVARAVNVFDDRGVLVDEKVRHDLQLFVEAFASFADAVRREKRASAESLVGLH